MTEVKATDERDDSKVVPLRPRTRDAGKLPIRRGPRPGLDACEHKYTLVDFELPQVECQDCGATLDPYWVLRELCAGYERGLREIKTMRFVAQQALDRAKEIREAAAGAKFRIRKVLLAAATDDPDGKWRLPLECGHVLVLHQGAHAPRRTRCFECVKPKEAPL